MEQVFTADFWSTVIQKTQEWIIGELPAIVITVLVVLISLRLLLFSLNKLKRTLIKRAGKNEKGNQQETEKRLDTLFGIIKGAVKIVLLFILIMIVLKNVGVDIAPILASAGILGLAIGFGAQELVRDYITGFFMLLENQVRVGDVAVINGQGGLVERIELRTITLRDFAQTVHIFRNGKIDTLSNMTKEWSAMVFDIGVAYKEDVNQVIDIMKQVGDELGNDPGFKSRILEPMEVFGLDSFGDSAIVIKGRIKTKPIEQWNVGREYRKRLKYAFDKHNIEIPFPHTTVYWGDEINPLKLDIAKNVN
ncbi:mechanosensitive ion channel family protein [uncultured Draconibacterium sp.]|uniref:mechanosensitive ion channel family protein n=1 Tax=uncultured Draconibacterium sp. TaxID=1573823 RepID=UPI0029C91AA5|nr:mechanosensitive ion channel family protein [uncultured Draconibacterium sp.]